MNVNEENKKKIREVVVQCLDNMIAPWDLTDDTQLISDLHFDSIIYISFIVMIEDQFNITIPNEGLSIVNFTTYGEMENMILSVIEAVNEPLKETEPASPAFME